MAKSKVSNSTPPEERPSLLFERAEAKARITAHIEKGNGLLDRGIQTEKEFDEVKSVFYGWEEYAYELLGTLFPPINSPMSFAATVWEAGRIAPLTRKKRASRMTSPVT